MTLSPSVLDAMLSAGCTAEQIVAAVKAASHDAEEHAAERRERDRIRKREERAAKKAAVSMVASELSVGQPRTELDSEDIPPPSLDKKYPQTPKELNLSAPASPTRGEFDQFWDLFPNRVGKADASKSFVKARQRVDFESLIAGLRRYVGKTDDRPWCNPATWLNQDRWADEPATVARAGPPQRPPTAQEILKARRQETANGYDDRPPNRPLLVASR